MVILFSPSEAKTFDGIYEKIDKDGFIFPEKYPAREVALKRYQDFIDSACEDDLKRVFGVKDEKLLKKYSQVDIFNDKTQKAVLRYSGIGYEYLDYKTLDSDSQEYIDNHLIIFSNLFGPISPKDNIPYYKLKQGEKIGDFAFEKYYKKEFTDILDKFLENSLILDLRASFYDKFYLPKKEYISFKFLKNGKVLSHWAKAYRGLVTREIAINKAQNEDDLMNINFKTLKILDIKKIKNKKEYLFEIVTN